MAQLPHAQLLTVNNVHPLRRGWIKISFGYSGRSCGRGRDFEQLSFGRRTERELRIRHDKRGARIFLNGRRCVRGSEASSHLPKTTDERTAARAKQPKHTWWAGQIKTAVFYELWLFLPVAKPLCQWTIIGSQRRRIWRSNFL